MLDKKIATCILTGGVVAQVFLAAKNVDLGKPSMDFLEKKELKGFIPGITDLIKKYPEEIKTPEDLAVEVNGKRKEISLKELPTNYSI